VVKKKRVEGNEGMVKRRRAKRKRTRGEEVEWKKLEQNATIRNYSLTIVVNMIMSCQEGCWKKEGLSTQTRCHKRKLVKKQRKKGRQE
jgi:hypothetical protein